MHEVTLLIDYEFWHAKSAWKVFEYLLILWSTITCVNIECEMAKSCMLESILETKLVSFLYVFPQFCVCIFLLKKLSYYQTFKGNNVLESINIISSKLLEFQKKCFF